MLKPLPLASLVALHQAGTQDWEYRGDTQQYYNDISGEDEVFFDFGKVTFDDIATVNAYWDNFNMGDVDCKALFSAMVTAYGEAST